MKQQYSIEIKRTTESNTNKMDRRLKGQKREEKKKYLGCPKAQTVDWLLNTESWVHSQVTSCEIPD
jgi:hypothetical protein